MIDPTTGAELAKFGQEVAKAASVGVGASEKFGGFISRITGESVEAAMGMITDRLQFARWERQLRLYDRWKQIVEERGFTPRIRPIPIKLALPIIEHGSLEDSDELQELWAQLLATAVDPRSEERPRTAFVDIIRQLEPSDAHLLRCAHDLHKASIIRAVQNPGESSCEASDSPKMVAIESPELRSLSGLPADAFETGLDNLLRVRCIGSYVSAPTKIGVAAMKDDGLMESETLAMTAFYSYDKVFVTPIGLAFVRACMPAV